MSSTLSAISGPYLERILTATAAAAVDGTLTDADRISLQQLALTVAAESFHEIAANGGAELVDPNVLLLLQQIGTLCDEEINPEELAKTMTAVLEEHDATQASNGGDSVKDAS